MPELVEVEAYRRLAEAALGRVVAAVEAPDAWYLKGGLTADDLDAVLVGRRFEAARRLGKLLLLDVGDGGPVVGVRFGMTGRLVLDGTAGVDRLIYSPHRRAPAWDRLVVRFADGGEMRVNDPRRLGGVILDPDEGRLGPDALSVGPAGLARALSGSTAPLKARIMDQARLAGVGNLLADEALWRAGLDPRRPAGSLSPNELRRLHRHLRATLAELGERGGSHTGDLGPHRRPGGICPRDGAELLRATVGGRTTWWCPRHQR
ncbi:MAG TPA: DNA-formamidopyrimidine glycosylase family protein [Acidimicrobiales bacterium]|nr:DNA-formamidopyrimidine glycosylase family protein [Acidimicrobiales bacterium]